MGLTLGSMDQRLRAQVQPVLRHIIMNKAGPPASLNLRTQKSRGASPELLGSNNAYGWQAPPSHYDSGEFGLELAQ